MISYLSCKSIVAVVKKSAPCSSASTMKKLFIDCIIKKYQNAHKLVE